MTIAVCDDEKITLNEVSRAIAEICPGAEIETFSSGKELIENSRKYNIIFLDIDMPDIDGMETAQNMRQNNRAEYIIFLTGHNEFMQKAFEVRAFRYLIKPLNKQELKKTLNDIQNEIYQNRQIVLKTQNNVIILNIAEIICIEAFGDGTYVYTKNDVCICNKTLKKWKNELGDEYFFQVHKSYIVSLKHIVCINKDELEVRYLSSPIPVSRRNRNALRETFFEYAKNNANIL